MCLPVETSECLLHAHSRLVQESREQGSLCWAEFQVCTHATVPIAELGVLGSVHLPALVFTFVR